MRVAENVTPNASARRRVTFPLTIEVNVTHLPGSGFEVTFSVGVPPNRTKSRHPQPPISSGAPGPAPRAPTPRPEATPRPPRAPL